MIVPLIGNVNYPITLDPSVWIFDDRKILLEEAFTAQEEVINDESDTLKKTAESFDRELSRDIIKPPVNKSLTRYEREKILVNSYVMPIKDFLSHAEVNSDAKDVTLVSNETEIVISLAQLQKCYLLFALKDKPLKNDGPVHLYFQDGSNQDNPIKGIKKIIINK